MGGKLAACFLMLVGTMLPAIQAQESVEDLQSSLAQLGRQMMLQKLSEEENVRADGNSGLKLARQSGKGFRPYTWDTHTNSRKIAAAHNHDNNKRTVGLGEFIAVLNGVEFRTRHNDYRLYMPSTTSSDWHATEEIPFPDVPPQVLEKSTVAEQIAEMKEYFRAFKEQNSTIRDYEDFFKPILCYLEGAWTTSVDSLDEPFESDRHFIDAANWYDLQDKIRFTSYTGGKSTLENFAYLPTTIMEMINGTVPRLAQWNYRILCHPLNNYLPLDRIILVDDLVVRMREQMDFFEYQTSRAARFQLNPRDEDILTNRITQHHLLDKLMEEIPGKDNYAGNITSDHDGAVAYPLDDEDKTTPLNVARYHRCFKVSKKDAMGLSLRCRGFHDATIWMAANNQPQVAPIKATFCEGWGNNKVCTEKEERWSYAIPLEIIYLTPLSSWNPYNLTYYGNANSPEAAVVEEGNRDGSANDTQLAYNGLHSKLYYLTPADFYTGMEDKDPADTSTAALWINDPDGVPRAVASSGVRINMQFIEGIGGIRQRYMIPPLYGEGNPIGQELEALKDIVMEPAKFAHMLRGERIRDPDAGLTLKTKPSHKDFGYHDHFIELTGKEVEALYRGDSRWVTTSPAGADQHMHHMKIVQKKWWSTQQLYYRYLVCDDLLKCEDNHPTTLIIQD